MKCKTFTFCVLLICLSVWCFCCLTFAAEKSKYEGQTVRIAMVWESREEALKNMTEEFEEKTGIKVVIDLMGNQDMKPKLLSLMQTKSPDYDIVQFDYSLLPFCVESGWLVDITDWVERDKAEVQPEDFHPALLQSHALYENRWYGFPLHVNSGAFFYRTDIFNEMGFKAPTDWEDVIDKAKVINEKYAPEVNGIAFMAAPDAFVSIWFQCMLASQGLDYYDANFKPLINTPGGEKAMDILMEFGKYAPKGFAAHSIDQVYSAMSQGNVAMCPGFSSGWFLFQDPKNSKVVDKVSIMANPGGNTILGGWFLAISAFGKNKEAAWEWLKWATSMEMEKRLLGNMECPRLSILKDPELQDKYPNNKVFYEALETNPLKMPMVKSVVELWMKAGVPLNEALTGITEPKEALERIHNDFTEVLKRDGYLKE
jgi:multiple sugar transport system substrate-binding protein